jgi:hypothetical protein
MLGNATDLGTRNRLVVTFPTVNNHSDSNHALVPFFGPGYGLFPGKTRPVIEFVHMQVVW